MVIPMRKSRLQALHHNPKRERAASRLFTQSPQTLAYASGYEERASDRYATFSPSKYSSSDLRAAASSVCSFSVSVRIFSIESSCSPNFCT